MKSAHRMTSVAILGLLAASPAHAACTVDVATTFRESAPRDSFRIVNDSAAASITAIEIDLDASAGRLVFDTVEGGTGVQVFQPYRSETGGTGLVGSPVVADGATALSLRFDTFGPGQSYTFSIDVDDRLTRSDRGQIMVSDREIDGTVIRFALRNPDGVTTEREAVFRDGNAARTRDGCS